DRSLHEHLDERAPLLDQLAGLRTCLLVRRDRRCDDGAALTRQPGRDPADPLDVRVAVLLREAEALRQVLADVVAVQVLDDQAALVELGPDDVRDRRLSGTREAGEPERETALAAALRLRVVVRVDVIRHAFLSTWMPHSSLSEPAQRPARSSSSGATGR